MTNLIEISTDDLMNEIARRKNEQVSQIQDQLVNLETTSSKIRYLLANGYTRSQVAKVLNIRYQHVRNVELNPKKG